jgi:hypothetical protein
MTLATASLAAQLPPEMRAAVPGDTAILIGAPAAKTVSGGLAAFLEACGAPPEAAGAMSQPLGLLQAPKALGIDIAPAVEADSDGYMLIAVSADLSDPLILRQLSEADAYPQALAAAGYEQTGDGSGLWVLPSTLPDGTSTTSCGAALRGSIAIMSKSEAAVRAALTASGGSALAAALGEPDAGSVTVLVDLAALIRTHRPQIEQAINMFTAMAAMAAAQQQQAGMNAVQIMGVYGELGRRLLDVGVETEWLRVTLTPTAESLRVDKAVRFAEDSAFLGRLSRHIDSPLNLAGHLPAGAGFQLVCTFDAERDGQLLTDFGMFFVRAMAPQDPELQAMIAECERMSLEYYETIGDQMAFAMYPSTGPIPGIVVLSRAPDPALSSRLYVDMMNNPAMAKMMSAAYGLPISGSTGVSGTASEEVQLVDLGEQSVDGQIARHIRLTGIGTVMRQMMQADPNTPPELQAIVGSMDAIDYWFAHTDELSIMTMEAEPEVLAQVLGSMGAPPAPPAFAVPITAGADLVGCLRLGRMFGWMGNMMPPEAPPLSAVGEAVAATEQGIWCSATMEERGLRWSVVVPSGDIAAVVQAFKSLARPSAQPTQ